MADWVTALTFSREVAVLVAQVAPVLLIAFVVEVRAIATRRALDGKDLTALIWIVVATFGLLLVGCLVLVNGVAVLVGWPALGAWAYVLILLGSMVALVAMSTWAATVVTTADVRIRSNREESVDALLTQPGWRWFIGRRSSQIVNITRPEERD
jgi:hypothetical protein